MNWEWLVVGAGVLVAAWWLARRLRKALRGESGCGCGAGANCQACPAAKLLDDPRPPAADAEIAGEANEGTMHS